MHEQNQEVGGNTKELSELTAASATDQRTALGAENVRFDLSDLYLGIHDPQIEADLQTVERAYASFEADFRGKLGTRLGDALQTFADIDRLSSKLDVFLYLTKSCNQADEDVNQVRTKFEERLANAGGNHLSFFEIEIGKLDESVVQSLAAADSRVAFHRPWIERVREEAKHLLSEEVERALTLRSPFGPSKWSKFVEERLVALVITAPVNPNWGADALPTTLSLEQATHILSESPNREMRAALMESINTTLKKEVGPLVVQALNVTLGKKVVEDKERGYLHPMSYQNQANMVSDEVVNALHETVRTKGAELAARFYKLMAKELGVPTLAWSDRNAPLAQTTTVVPWDEAVEIVRQAFGSFSPTLQAHFDRMVQEKRIDAPHYPNKETGAYNLSAVFPDPIGARSYNLHNFMGTLRDVQTLAHEAGHGAHGELSGSAQGPLMQHAPIAYAETASIFGEMVTFQFLLERVGSPEEKLALLMNKTKDFMNTVVRQISFSVFEQKIHEARKNGELTTKEFVAHWQDAMQEFYGKPGEVFTYENVDHLWSYISHFYRPFYVYGYAFGELLTQSLVAAKETLGDKFEPLYLDLLRAGSSKDVVALLEPFGLDPKDPQFWSRGMEASVEKWISEAERLATIIEESRLGTQAS